MRKDIDICRGYIIKILLTLTLLLPSFIAKAGITGNEWLALNEAGRLYTVIGMIEGLESMDLIHFNDCGKRAEKVYGKEWFGKGVCPHFASYLPPTAVTMGQEVKVFEKYLAMHPSKTHLPASKLLLDALLEAFPFDMETFKKNYDKP